MATTGPLYVTLKYIIGKSPINMKHKDICPTRCWESWFAFEKSGKWCSNVLPAYRSHQLNFVFVVMCISYFLLGIFCKCISYFTRCICRNMYFLFCTWCKRSDCWNGAPCISVPSTPPSLSERPVTVLRVQANQIARLYFVFVWGQKTMKISIS